MNKLTIKLKQHTPIIHFQHEQDGATLRATEVKPKLDRFIIKEKFQDNFDECKEYLIGYPKDETDEKKKKQKEVLLKAKFDNGFRALNYKMRINLVNGSNVETYVIGNALRKFRVVEYERAGYKVLGNTPYFADNKPLGDGSLSDVKLGVMAMTDIEIHITCFNDDLRNLIKIKIKDFFSITNFGSRQNKGFGCFYPIELGDSDFEKCLAHNFDYVTKLNKKLSGLDEIYKEINNVYKVLKSGDRNSDSKLRGYFGLKPIIEWEKPAIQEKIAEATNQTLNISSRSSDRQFVRALLGLPELYEYPKQDVKVKLSSVGGTVERYSSPILFKVYKSSIYMVACKENDDILDKEFSFKFEQRGRQINTPLSLSIPEDFDLVDFIEFAMKGNKQWERIDT